MRRTMNNDTLARRLFRAFDEHVHVPPELEAKLLQRLQEELDRKPEYEACAHCPHWKHLHEDRGDGVLTTPAGCPGYEPLT